MLFVQVTEDRGRADRRGEFLGAYRIERLIGVGAMGTVWAVRHARFGGPAVAKIHERDLDDEPGHRERFLREAALLSAVRHPNVVERHEVGETADSEPYLILEQLEGQTLDEQLLDAGSRSEEDTIEVGLGLLAGLEAVHAAGVLHRDVKPENVFLALSGGGRRIKLLDFGLARGLDQRARKITRKGAAVGTPGYMSPEQARGRRDLDVRCDLYSVGVVLYEMLAGRRPFVGATATDIMVRACTEEPFPLSSIRPSLDRSLVAFVMRALSRERDARPSDACSMRKALVALGAGLCR